MQANQLVSTNDPSLVRWMCSGCETLWLGAEQAEACCDQSVCEECKVKVPTGFSICTVCSPGDRIVFEDTVFSDASKVAYSEYEEPFIFWSSVEIKGKYFRNKTELERYCMVGDLAPPRWVWACKASPLKFSAESLIDSENQHIRCNIDDIDVERLQEQINSWTLEQPTKMFEPDFSKVVILDYTLLEKPSKVEVELEG